MNIYTTKTGLRKAQVEYGWGMEMEATYFPVELAKMGLELCSDTIAKGKNGILGKLNAPEVMMLMSYCSDVIENAKKGEDTYVLDVFMADQLKEMEHVAKYLESVTEKK